MNAREIIKILDAAVLLDSGNLDIEIVSGCGSDMMSDVLAFVKGKSALLTGLTNLHVVRTAEITEAPLIIFVRGKIPPEDVVQRAKDDHISLIQTRYTMFEACGMLYAKGLRGESGRHG